MHFGDGGTGCFGGDEGVGLVNGVVNDKVGRSDIDWWHVGADPRIFNCENGRWVTAGEGG